MHSLKLLWYSLKAQFAIKGKRVPLKYTLLTVIHIQSIEVLSLNF